MKDIPAFPNVGDGERYDGMTLRDYFAGQAIIGLLNISPNQTGRGDITQILVESAYQVADAMLAERSKESA